MPRTILMSSLVFLFSLLVSGCVTVLETVKKADQPIPTELVASMRSKGMTSADPVLIRLFKEESELEVWKRDKSGRYALLKTFPICRWSGQLGPKTREGDRQAPEGFYQVIPAGLNPNSNYYLSFNIGYPNKLERALGYTGSAIMVHGACSSSGCYALTDRGMAEIYPLLREAVTAGQKSIQVQIFPFRMSVAKMLEHEGNPNSQFWKNLKVGYDSFELSRKPPLVGSCGGRYVFASATGTELPNNPLGDCPGGASKSISEVAANGSLDGERSPQINGNPQAPGAHAYSDGSMNPYFRRILEQKGAAKLAEMTSLTNVPVSRPQAALFEPHLAAPMTD
jgi:murein L,D-transpeptidase YafK